MVRAKPWRHRAWSFKLWSYSVHIILFMKAGYNYRGAQIVTQLYNIRFTSLGRITLLGQRILNSTRKNRPEKV